MKSFFAILSTFFLLLISCKEQNNPNDSSEDHWSYKGETGPKHWAEIEKQSNCDGNFQSPINIVNFKTDSQLKPLQIHYSEQTILHDVTNNGHSIQYNFEAGDYVLIDQDSFQLKQFHFHEPAEHTIKGMRYPLEIHLVHQNKNKKFVVLSVMAQEGRNSAPFQFLENFLPLQKGETKFINKAFNIESTLPKNRNYFTYKGSLTTPPCTENVEWFVFQNPIEVSLEQVELLKYLMPINNYREEQPVHGRAIRATQF